MEEIKKLLEEYPLYRKIDFKLPAKFSQFPKPPIHMHCGVCQSEQTFNLSNEWNEGYPNDLPGKRMQVVRLEYRCDACKQWWRFFLIPVTSNGLMKAGQYPPWEISSDPLLAKQLGKHQLLLKYGLTCESQSYGIGAFAYYRAVVESIIDQLLDDIGDLIDGVRKAEYQLALEQTRQTKRAHEKIKLVKELLPPILRPNGMNPLVTLYEVLSEGLHGKSDDDCMELADSTRKILVFLVTQVQTSRTAAKEFTEGMRKLLDRKAKKHQE